MLLVAGLIISGCSQKYVQPDETRPYATLTATSSREAYNEGVYFSAFDDQACTIKEGFGEVVRFAALLGDKPVTIRLLADRRIYILGSNLSVYANSDVTTTQTCADLVSFVPVQGKNYQAYQLKSEKGCATVIADPETKAQPPTIERHRAQDCKFEKK